VRRARLPAAALPLEQALPLLTRCRALGAGGRGRASASTAFWGAAVTVALSLLARARVLPGVSAQAFDAWRVGPYDAQDLERLRVLAVAMPPEARAVPVHGVSPLTPAAEPLLRAFLDAIADSLTRTSCWRRSSRRDGRGGESAISDSAVGSCLYGWRRRGEAMQ
jgi:hypothetical protein